MITRKQYMDKEVDHQTYYAQFVTPGVVNFVEQIIGRDRIIAADDPSFNDIPLGRWDRMHDGIVSAVGRKIADANGNNGISLSDTVCVAKAAARMIRDAAKERA